MSRYGKCVLTGLCVLAGYAVIVRGMDLMNRTSDFALYVGLTMAVGTLLVWPFLLRGIWRHVGAGKERD